MSKSFNFAGAARVRSLIAHALAAAAQPIGELSSNPPIITGDTAPPSGAKVYEADSVVFALYDAYPLPKATDGSVRFWQSTFNQGATTTRPEETAPGKEPVTAWRAGFMTDAQVVYIPVKANGEKHRLWVRGPADACLLLAEDSLYSESNGIKFQKVDFGTAEHREIVIESERKNPFYGVAVPDGNIVWKPRPSPVVALVTDSQGAVDIFPKFDGMVRVVGDHLGVRHIQNCSLGTAGLLNRNVEENNFMDRFASDVVPCNPDLLFIAMTANDWAWFNETDIATYAAAWDAYLTAARLALPDRPIIIGGIPTMGGGPILPQQILAETTVADLVAERGDDMIRFFPAQTDPQGQWTYDSNPTPLGERSGPEATGSIPCYGNAVDEFHLSAAGAFYIGKRYAERVLTALQEMETLMHTDVSAGGTPDTGERVYWGVKVFAGHAPNNGFAGFRRVRLFDGLTELTPVGVEVSSTSESGHPPEDMIDGEPLSHHGWHRTSSEYPCYVMLELAVPALVTSVKLDCWGYENNANAFTLVKSREAGFNAIESIAAFSAQAALFGEGPSPANGETDSRETLTYSFAAA